MATHNSPKAAGIILAAGMATRLGQNKQLVTIDGRHAIERVVDAASRSSLDRLILVLGFEAQKTLRAIQNRIEQYEISVIVNPHYADGMSSSVKAGLKAAVDYEAAMFLLGDQPLLEAKCIDTLLHSFWQSEALIVAPTCQGKRRNPVVFAKALYPEILEVSGDQGAREIIRRYQEQTALIEFDEPRWFLDIDSKADLERARAFYKWSVSGTNE